MYSGELQQTIVERFCPYGLVYMVFINIYSVMKINQQKFKTSSLVIQSYAQPAKNGPHSTKEPLESASSCNCITKLNLLTEEIVKINQKIAFIFRIIQISSEDEVKGVDSQEGKPKVSENLLRAQQKQFSQQSFLLDGIESQICLSGKPKTEKDPFHKGNILIGKEVADLKSKMKEIQDKWEQFIKFKNNFSLLTKIVEKMQIKFENESRACRMLGEIEMIKSKNVSNCSIEEPERKTMESVQSSFKTDRQKDIQKKRGSASHPQTQPRKSIPLKEDGKAKSRTINQQNKR